VNLSIIYRLFLLLVIIAGLGISSLSAMNRQIFLSTKKAIARQQDARRKVVQAVIHEKMINEMAMHNKQVEQDAIQNGIMEETQKAFIAMDNYIAESNDDISKIIWGWVNWYFGGDTWVKISIYSYLVDPPVNNFKFDSLEDKLNYLFDSLDYMFCAIIDVNEWQKEIQELKEQLQLTMYI